MSKPHNNPDISKAFCLQIIARGIYHYNHVNDLICQYDENYFVVHDLCFHIRSLAELTNNMSIWLDSEENLEHVFIDSIKDLAGITRRLEKLYLRSGKSLEPDVESLTDELEQGILKLSGVLSKINKKSEASFLAETVIITSKFIHADEASILISSSPEIFGEILVKTFEARKSLLPILKSMARQWQQIFRLRVHIAYLSYEAYFKSCKLVFPFDYQKSPVEEESSINMDAV